MENNYDIFKYLKPEENTKISDLNCYDLEKLISLIKKHNNNIRFIDPLKNKSENPEVCPLDIKDINRSDFVVVYINKLSIGTLLELGYCIFTNKKGND